MKKMELKEETLVLIVIWICTTFLTIFQKNSEYVLIAGLTTILWAIALTLHNSKEE